jgi:hypothetical protein
MSVAIKFLKHKVRVTVRKPDDVQHISHAEDKLTQGSVRFGSETLRVHVAQEKMNWEDAVAYAKSLGGGWRLPTKEEFDDLCKSEDTLAGFSDIARRAFPSAEIDEKTARPRLGFWSGSTVSYLTYLSWIVNLGNGYTYYNSKNLSYGVVCVRP